MATIKDKPLLSVIVPYYNVEQYIEKCICSIMNQTYSNMQIILVDDGSTDNSSEVCKKYQKVDSRIEIVHKKNGGVVSAKKAGMQLARGSLVAWVDSDDWIEPEYFEDMVDLQIKNDADIVAVGHYHDIGETSKKVLNGMEDGVYSVAEILHEVLYYGKFYEYGIAPHLCTKLIRRNIAYPFQMSVDESIVAGDDAAVVYPSILKAKKMVVSSISGYHYVQRQGSVTKTKRVDEESRVSALINYLRSQFKEYDAEDIMFSQLVQYEKYLWLLRDLDIFDKKNIYPYGKEIFGSKVIIYGAGVMGQNVSCYITGRSDVDAVAWVDQNYMEYRRRGMQVDSPEKIIQLNGRYDYIIIANISESTSQKIRKYLVDIGIADKKILWLSDEFIK